MNNLGVNQLFYFIFFVDNYNYFMDLDLSFSCKLKFVLERNDVMNERGRE